jgi:hypothetical protein
MDIVRLSYVRMLFSNDGVRALDTERPSSRTNGTNSLSQRELETSFNVLISTRRTSYPTQFSLVTLVQHSFTEHTSINDTRQ